MKPEAQRIAIAEACGRIGPFETTRDWIEGPSDDGSGYDGFYDNLRSADGRLVPNYLTDLNAMHVAEKVLTHELWDRYELDLWEIVAPGEPIQRAMPFRYRRAFLSSTARQRAEAFLRIIGKWQE